LIKSKLDVLIEKGAGESAGFPDRTYVDKGVRVAASRSEVFSTSDVIVQVRSAGGNPEGAAADSALYRQGQVVIGMCEPLTTGAECQAAADRGVTLFAMELVPRTTRAQAMDVLSSQATIAGYKAVLLAADSLPRIFPMLTTAAGTIKPARVLVIGAGVAGLQAIATARRLGAAVSGYDIRAVVKEQIESLGAKFVVLDVQAGDAQDKGGYARAMDEDFYRRQREAMARVLAENEVVISTAAVPGKKAPILITAQMAEAMAPGAIIVDVAAERGGNCELTQPGRNITTAGGVTIMGPLNLPSTIPYDASSMYAKNIANFLKLMVTKEGQFNLNLDDDIVKETLVAREGRIVHPRVQEALGTAPQPAVATA
jgi:NAD(P) transhydrogenase subunit alpha